jgi:hypothetical protein
LVASILALIFAASCALESAAEFSRANCKSGPLKLADALKYFLSVLKSEQGILVILVVFSTLDIGFLLVQ